jgi:4-hydroxyphenylacetate 3-monooxygenase
LDWTHVLEKHNKQWAENARDYHRYVSSNDLCLTHVLTDQYYDRTKRASEQEDARFDSSHRRRNHGWEVMRGLRTLATLAPISDEVSESAARTEEVDYAIAFAIPMNTLGIENRLSRSLRGACRS